MYDRFLRVASSVKTVTWIRQSYSRIHRPHPFLFGWVKTAEPLSLPLTWYLYYIILFAVCQEKLCFSRGRFTVHQGVFWNFSKYFFSRCLSVYYYVQIPRFENFCLPLNLPLLYHRFEVLSSLFLKFSEKIFGRCLRVYNIMNAPAFSDFQNAWTRKPLAFDTLIIAHLWEFVKGKFLFPLVDGLPSIKSFLKFFWKIFFNLNG